MWLIHMHKSCYCPSIPESSSQPSASVFFGPVSGGGLEKIRLFGRKYIYIFTADRERKDDCVVLDNKGAFCLEPIRMLCRFSSDTFLF